MRKQKRKPVKPVVNDKIMNLHNPKLVGMTEFAFEASGIKYHCFKQDTEVRYGRYVVLMAYLQEYNLRMDLDTHKANIKQLQEWMNPGLNKDGTVTPIRLDKCQELLTIMEQRANIAFEPDTVYRLASCLYFDDKEVISSYDKPYNEAKIARWKEDNTTDFFFHKLFVESTRLKVTSKDALQNYLHKQAPEHLKELSLLKDILLR